RQPQPDANSLSFTLLKIGDLAYEDGRLGDAESAYARALATCEQSSACDDLRLGAILLGLAESGRKLGKYVEAEGTARRFLGLVERRFGRESLDAALALQVLGRTYLDTGRHAEAEPLLRRGLAIREGFEESLDLATTLRLLAWVDWWRGRHREADEKLSRAIAIIERRRGPLYMELAFVLVERAMLAELTNADADAEPLYGRALAIADAHPKFSLVDLADIMESYARVLRALHRRGAALRHMSSAVSSLAHAMASGWATAWFWPIGRSKTMRSLAYWTARSSAARPIPTASIPVKMRSGLSESRRW